MIENLKDMIMRNIKEYEEKLELLKMEKSEVIGDVKKVERLKKLVEKASIDGVTLDVPQDEDKSGRLEEVEKEIKIVKSILRRYDTICEMYEIKLIEDEEITTEEV